MSLAVSNEIGGGLVLGRAGVRLGDLLSTCSVGEMEIMGLGYDLIMFACTGRHECVLFAGCSDIVPHRECGI